MKTAASASVLVLLVLASLFAQAPAAGRKFQVVELRGTPYQRGLQHGRLLRASIRAGVKAWKDNLRLAYRSDPDLFIGRFLSATDYAPAIEKWTPGLLREVRGIADGAGVDFPALLVYQLPDEYWVHGSLAAGDHCSALGVAATREHPAVVAQNADLEGFRDGLQTILHITGPSGLEQFVVTVPGLIGFHGMNSKGVAVAANTVSELGGAREGLPVAFVVRGLLERATFDEARSFLGTVRHASGQNYTLGGGGRVACFEASGGNLVRIDPPRAEAFVYHTNHSVTGQDPGGTIQDSSHARYEALRRRLSVDPGKDVVSVVQETLRSQDSNLYPISRPHLGGDRVFTFASSIMVLGAEPYLIAAPGPPHEFGYAVFRFGSK